jgi:hypothetical protein
MIKSFAKIAFVVVLAALLYVFVIAEEKPWFDMDNCAFCKNLKTDPALLDHMPIWEHHNIHNGALTITQVDEAYLPSYEKAMAAMEEVGKRMEKGEQLPMCGMCTAYGEVMMQGAKSEEIKSGNLYVSIMYSDNPEVVKKIHAMTDRTNEEMKKMEEMEKMEKMQMEKQSLEKSKKEPTKK